MSVSLVIYVAIATTLFFFPGKIIGSYDYVWLKVVDALIYVNDNWKAPPTVQEFLDNHDDHQRKFGS